MKIWVTRTAPDAEATAERLRSLGHDPVIAPLLEVRALPNVKLDLKGVTALVFTSRNGVAAFAALSRRRNLPVYTVGGATADAAHAAGFGAVSSADGAFAELVALIALHPPAGRLLWPGPTEPAGDLAGQLEHHGVACTLLPVYETVQTAVVPPAGIDAVLIHSPKAARVLAHMLQPRRAKNLRLLAISAHAAEPLSHLPFAAVEIAAAPNETALLDLTVRPGGANQSIMTSTEPSPLDPTPPGAAAGAAATSLPGDPSAYRRDRGVSRTALILACLASVVVGVAVSRLVPGLPQTPSDPSAPAPWFAPAPKPDVPLVQEAAPLPPVAETAEVADLSARLARIEAVQQRTSAAAGAALATAALLQAAQTSRPFTAELAAVETLLPPADTATLRRAAQTGIPTRSMLAEEFPAVAARASAAAHAPKADAGLLVRAQHALSGIVTIRRVEGGKGSDGIIVRAEQLVGDGDLEGALIEMRRLPPAAQAAFVPWLAKAERRIDLDRRLAAVRAASLAALRQAERQP